MIGEYETKLRAHSTNLLDDINGVSWLETIPATWFPDRFVRHGDPTAAVRTSLLAVLAPDVETDAHWAPYWSPEDRRLACEDEGVEVHFTALVLELDHVLHNTGREAYDRDAFFCVLSVLRKVEFDLPGLPNAAYATTTGSRLLWVLDKDVDDIGEYLAKRAGLMDSVAEILDPILEGRFRVDHEPRDWTRIWRAPRVVRAEPTGTGGYRVMDLRDRPVWLLHTEPLSWEALPSARVHAPSRARILRSSPVPSMARSADRSSVATLPGAGDGPSTEQLLRLAMRDPRLREFWESSLVGGERNGPFSRIAYVSYLKYGEEAGDLLLQLHLDHLERCGGDRQHYERSVAPSSKRAALARRESELRGEACKDESVNF